VFKKGGQWNALHNAIKHFIYKCGKHARIELAMEKGVGVTRHRPGDVRVKGGGHGWKAAHGNFLLMDVTVACGGARPQPWHVIMSHNGVRPGLPTRMPSVHGGIPRHA
jgi:hypothetical protein